MASTTLSYPTAANDATTTITLSGEPITPVNPTKCCRNGVSCDDANFCLTTFKTAGFIFSSTASGAIYNDIATQISGKPSGQYYLRAVQTNTTTQKCESALTGSQQVAIGYTCVSPASCTSGSNWMTLAGSSFGSSGSAPTFTFDAVTGAAPFTFKFDDAGKINLTASKTTSNGAVLAGTSNGFVVRPAGLCVYSTDLAACSAANATCPVAKKAGVTFNLTVKAVGWESDSDADYCSAGNAITPNYKATGIVLGSELIAPASGASGSVGIPSTAITSNGWAAVNQSISEVGVFKFTATPPDYIDAGVSLGGPYKSGSIGRFIPDHFAITAGTVAPACINPSSSFTYFGQDGVTTPFTLTAQNLTNGTTQNYTDSFTKLPLTTWGAAPASAASPGFGFSAATLPAGSVLSSSATAPSGAWPSLLAAQANRGVAAITAKHKVSRPTALTGITSLTISATPVDSDGVSMTTTHVALASNFYYGRLRMQNQYGSELLALPMSLTTQYWTTSGWLLNTLDGCTSLPVPIASSGLNFGAGNLAAGETTASINGTTAGSGTVISGNAGFSLTKPGTGNNGFVTITIATPDWLKFPWVTAGVDTDATARATFGIYKSPLIYRRENY